MDSGLPTNLRLASGAVPFSLPSMKFALAILVYLLMGLLLVAGMLMAMNGSLWLLITAALAYLVAFARIGCATH